MRVLSFGAGRHNAIYCTGEVQAALAEDLDADVKQPARMSTLLKHEGFAQLDFDRAACRYVLTHTVSRESVLLR